MFLENESKLSKCRVNLSFWRISLRQPVCSYTPITIIRMISWARNVGTWDFYISIAMFCDYCFLSIFDASINFIRCFPLMIKKKKKNKRKTEKKTLNPWIDFVNLKVLFLRNSTELDFSCSNGVCLPNVLKNMFIMLFP